MCLVSRQKRIQEASWSRTYPRWPTYDGITTSMVCEGAMRTHTTSCTSADHEIHRRQEDKTSGERGWEPVKYRFCSANSVSVSVLRSAPKCGQQGDGLVEPRCGSDRLRAGRRCVAAVRGHLVGIACLVARACFCRLQPPAACRPPRAGASLTRRSRAPKQRVRLSWKPRTAPSACSTPRTEPSSCPQHLYHRPPPGRRSSTRLSPPSCRSAPLGLAPRRAGVRGPL